MKREDFLPQLNTTYETREGGSGQVLSTDLTDTRYPLGVKIWGANGQVSIQKMTVNGRFRENLGHGFDLLPNCGTIE